jgi:hypothetical protein
MSHLEPNSKKIVGPKNNEELGNYEIALFFSEKNKKHQKKAA